ncbi:MAG: hypothetical protein IPN95_25225 [Bacteroidetes bacterium]|nr:hypothetical protein [Bacteroidota bacterium]
MEVIISLIALAVSLTALIFSVRSYWRKSGIYVRGQYSVHSSSYCKDKYVGSITLENVKDRPVVIFKVFLLVGRNYYIELENFEHDPKILKPYEVYSNQYDPVDFYSVNMRRIKLNELLDSKKVKSNLVLATSNGRYTVGEWIKRWDPVSDFFNNHMTALIYPMRSTYKNKCFGSEVKYIVDIKTEDGKEETIAIYPRDHEIRKFRKFSLTKECLESKDSLEELLLERAFEGDLKCVNIVVHDIEEWRKERYGNDYQEVIEAKYCNWFMYEVLGRAVTKFSDIRLYFVNRKHRKANKALQRTSVSLQPHHLPTFLQQCFNILRCERQQFIDSAVRPGGEFFEGVG